MAHHGTAAIVSFRLGGTDGVAVESRKWSWALEELGYRIVTVAGDGEADVVIPGIGMHGETGADRAGLARRLTEVFTHTEIVVAENICSLPLNPSASAAVAESLESRRAILHHHDLPSQRPHLAHLGTVPTDPRWLHVTINGISRDELRRAGIGASVIYNRFDPDPPSGRREEMRAAMGIRDGAILLLHPTRALERKNVPAAVELASALSKLLPSHPVAYWLMGPAEDGYEEALEGVIAAAEVPVVRGLPDGDSWSIHDAYGACDAVVFPSTWEGFGNPTVESATHDRPLAVGDYPVAAEIAWFGFTWFPSDDAAPLASYLSCPDPAMLAHNHAVAREHFALADLPGQLAALLSGAGWL